jgi:hypothetical protein
MLTLHFKSALVVATLALAACAQLPQVKDALLTYETSPEGAQLFEGGQALGAAPVTRTYKHDGKSETIRTPEVTAVWPSGAKETFFTILPPGADRVATIERPARAPGLQVDLDNAKTFIATKAREAQRIKDLNAREVSRNSARCREQIAKGMVVSDDC